MPADAAAALPFASTASRAVSTAAALSTHAVAWLSADATVHACVYAMCYAIAWMSDAAGAVHTNACVYAMPYPIAWLSNPAGALSTYAATHLSDADGGSSTSVYATYNPVLPNDIACLHPAFDAGGAAVCGFARPRLWRWFPRRWSG